MWQSSKAIKVMDAMLWQDIKAYGTYEYGHPDMEFWSYNGLMYCLCFRDLPMEEQNQILEMYSEF